MNDSDNYIKKPRFDNVISAGTLLQMATIIVGLIVGGVMLYSSMKYESDKQADRLEDTMVKLDRMDRSITSLADSMQSSYKELDGRLRVVETELPRRGDKLDALTEEVRRIGNELQLRRTQ